jgi:hypothetical protein
MRFNKSPFLLIVSLIIISTLFLAQTIEASGFGSTAKTTMKFTPLEISKSGEINCRYLEQQKELLTNLAKILEHIQMEVGAKDATEEKDKNNPKAKCAAAVKTANVTSQAIAATHEFENAANKCESARSCSIIPLDIQNDCQEARSDFSSELKVIKSYEYAERVMMGKCLQSAHELSNNVIRSVRNALGSQEEASSCIAEVQAGLDALIPDWIKSSCSGCGHDAELRNRVQRICALCEDPWPTDTRPAYFGELDPCERLEVDIGEESDDRWLLEKNWDYIVPSS